MFAESKHDMIAVEFIGKGNRTGVHSSLEVSLQKEIAYMLGEQITAGKLTEY
jgi:hypothetical protein